MRAIGLTFLLVLIMAGHIRADSENFTHAKSLFETAGEEYRDGNYNEALELYLRVKEYTIGFSINYNLGNTYFKLDKIPESILHFERALKFEPSNEDAIHNLQLANAQIVDRIEILPRSKFDIWWKDFVYGIGPEGWAKTSLVLSVSSALLLLSYFILRRQGVRKFAFFTAIFLVLLLLGSIWLANAAKTYRDSHVSAVIFTDKVDVRSEPRDAATNVFVLHAGTKVSLLNENNGWFEIELASGNQGWVRKQDLEPI